MSPGQGTSDPMGHAWRGMIRDATPGALAGAGQVSLGTIILNAGIRTTTGRPSPVVPR